ncbi:MAG TPA: MBL fold metallo-hydrolase, partial [Nitrospirota bacterium]
MEALRPQPHPSHLTVEKAISIAAELGFSHTALTHMAHEMDYDGISAQLPGNVVLAHDGMVIEV